eukprot:5693179-Prymnesium_polylepis.2
MARPTAQPDRPAYPAVSHAPRGWYCTNLRTAVTQTSPVRARGRVSVGEPLAPARAASRKTPRARAQAEARVRAQARPRPQRRRASWALAVRRRRAV